MSTSVDRPLTVAPGIVPEPDWVEIEPFPRGIEAEHSFVSGGPSGRRLRVAYFQRPPDLRLFGRAWFGAETEGPPGHAHGGAVASVMDEALGAAAWAAGHAIVVAHLEVDFRTMVPLGTDATFETWVESVEGRKVFTRGTLRGADDEVFAEGRALCIVLADAHIEKLRAAHWARRARAGGGDDAG